MHERRVFAHMVTRNEADRYLDVVLRAVLPHVYDLHVYDDASTDGTVALAQDLGAVVTPRLPGRLAFAEGESAFRYDAWRAFETRCGPCPGDWVLALDADELLIAPDGLWPSIEAAGKSVAVAVPIPEVFELDGSTPMVRTDGFWQGLEQPRLFRYHARGVFRCAAMACGSVPTYASLGPQSVENPPTLLHLGYLDPSDRADKYRRYAGAGGHSKAHVNSILTPALLAPWDGSVEVWRGRLG